MKQDLIYDIIRYNLKENILISDDNILDYIHKRLEEENLSEYVSFVTTCNDDESFFDPKDNHLCINTEEIFLENADKNIPDLLKLINKKDKDNFILNNKNYGNIYNLCTVNHEINHLIQKKEIYQSDNLLTKNLFNFGKALSFIDERFFNSFYYIKYHDRFYDEYNANINAYNEVISLLEAYKLKNIEKDLIKLNNLVSKHILYSYSDIDNKYKYSTPFKNSLKIYSHLLKKLKEHDIDIQLEGVVFENIKNNEPNSQIERLLYGFSINNDTYKYLKKVSSSREKTLNLFNDINC